MKIITYSKTAKFTDSMITEAENKFKKLEKFAKDDEPLKLTIETFKKDKIRLKAQLVLKNNKHVRIEADGEDYYACLNDVVDNLKHQASCLKEKNSRKDRIKKVEIPVENVEDPAIKKIKHFELEKITEGMAVMEMEKLGHEFYLFRNINEDDKVCALYKRLDGDYSMIVIEH